jgi:hypothetical protein
MIYLVGLVVVLCLISFAFGREAARAVVRWAFILGGIGAVYVVLLVISEMNKPPVATTTTYIPPGARH